MIRKELLALVLVATVGCSSASDDDAAQLDEAVAADTAKDEQPADADKAEKADDSAKEADKAADKADEKASDEAESKDEYTLDEGKGDAAPAGEDRLTSPAEDDASAPAVEAPAAIAEKVESASEAKEAKSAPAAAPASQSAATAGAEMYVSATGLNVRSSPSMEGSILRVLPHGEKVKVQGQEGNWVKIGENEYVSAKYLTSSSN